jgi:5-methylcytosine-specific restriction protein A
MRYVVSIDDIMKTLYNLGGEAKTRHIQTEVLRVYCDGVVPDNYKNERTFRMTIQRKIEDYCPQADGFENNSKPAKLQRVGHGIYRVIGNTVGGHLAEEVEEPEQYLEGATKKIAINSYERNPIARQKCIEHYGPNCSVCAFNFEATYGELGAGYIHVHHLKPLSEITTEYQVDPIKDLRPVCPNCHAMLHRGIDSISIESLKAKLNNNQN